MPDQFNDMCSEARVMKKSIQRGIKPCPIDSSYRSSKVPEKEHFVQDRDDDEGFLPLLTKHTGIIHNKMLSCVPYVASFSRLLSFYCPFGIL